MSFNHFDFSVDYVLENERVKITPFENHHIEQLKDISEDKTIWTYFLEKGEGGEAFNTYCHTALYNRRKGIEYPFVIFDKQSKCYAGMTRLYDYHSALGTIKMGHTWLGSRFWGSKLNTHCKCVLFEYIFETLGLERIGFGVHGQNYRSIRALTSVGCKQEGMLRNFLIDVNGNKRVDLLLYSLLKSEWNSKVKEKLKSKLT